MSHSERLCPSCGRPLPASGPPACPRCLLDRALAGSQSSPLVQTAAGAPIDANAGALPDPAELARHFPRLEIGELLGRGAMGSVWRARQLELSRDVALKVLAPATSNDPSFRARFEREARALAALDHPHIVRVYDYGQAGPYSFLLMELVEGASLRELLQQGRLGEAEVLGLARDTCAALAYAHARGVVHRDIKPENLLVDGAGRIKVADFGLAKLVGPAATASLRSSGGERVGTPLYMAPEQLEQPASVDHRADLYALGVVLYELLTGELPIGRFDAPSKRGSPSARYDSVVLRALEKDREQRQRDAEEVQSELDAATSGPEPVATPAPSPSAAAAGTPKLELSRTALFFSERFRYTDYLLAGLLLLGIQALPFSKPLRALLTLAFCSGLVAVVFVAIRALRGTARGHGLQFTASTLGAGLAVLGGLHADQLLHALFGSEAALTNADRYLTWAICAVEAVLLSIWSVVASRRALAAFEGRRRWRLWIGAAVNVLGGVSIAHRVLVEGEGMRHLPLALFGVFAVVDIWNGRRDMELTGPFVRGAAGAAGKCVKLEFGGKRDVDWIRALRRITGCSLEQANAARRTTAEWLVAAELDETAARELAQNLSDAGVNARVVDAEHAAARDVAPANPS